MERAAIQPTVQLGNCDSSAPIDAPLRSVSSPGRRRSRSCSRARIA